MKRISGYLLVLLGCLHVLVGVFGGWIQIKAILSYGVWNALGQKPQALCMKSTPCLQVNSIWWFIAWGLMLILFGFTCIWVERKLERPVPAFIAWLLLLISIICAILIPASGFWVVMLVAIYMIICSHHWATRND